MVVMQNMMDKVNKKIRRYNKNGISNVSFFIAHNHPSGDFRPSGSDVTTTEMLGSAFPDNFRGQVVLDHDKYTFINTDGMVKSPATFNL